MLEMTSTLKAYNSNGEYYLMTPEQRLQLFNVLDYKQMKKISDTYDKYDKAFYNVINETIREQTGKETKPVNFIDFLIFFYGL